MSFSQLEQEFVHLTAAFEFIASRYQGTQQRFMLVRIASLFRLPKSEVRRLYDSWALESSVVGGDSNG